jgi:hypothetical protein
MRRLITLGGLLAVLAALIVAQLVLPGIAAQHLRSQLSRSGTVLSVQVSAFPAIELLWHHADKVVIRMARYRQAPAGELGSTLGQTGDAGTLDASAQEFDDGLLRLHDARLRKRGDQLIATARIDEADLRSALPILSSVTPVASADGQLTLRGTSTLLPFAVDFTIGARNGDLVAAPDVPLGALATITLFHNPQIAVQSVNAAAVPGGFTVQTVGTVR